MTTGGQSQVSGLALCHPAGTRVLLGEVRIVLLIVTLLQL